MESSVGAFKPHFRVLDEKVPLIKRNKILILCAIALSLDPLFCYVLLVHDEKKCLGLDRTLRTIAIVSRSAIDFLFILHIIFQVCATRSINPVDILAILPLPQVLVFAIIPELNNLRVLKATKSLNFIFIFQYVLRFLQICSLLKRDLGSSVYVDALASGVVDSADIVQRISYCFCWGLQNLSSLGQGLKTTYVWQIYFSIFISISGLLSFAFLIGNVQAYLLSEVARSEGRRVRVKEMRLKRQEMESWRPFLSFPENLRERILQTIECKLQENILIDVHNFLPHDPWTSGKIQYHILAWIYLKIVQRLTNGIRNC